MASERYSLRRRRRGHGLRRTGWLLLGLLSLILHDAAAREIAAERLTVDGDPVRSVAASAGGGALYAVGNAALHRSDDGGLNWQPVGPPPPGSTIAVGDGVPGVHLADIGSACADSRPKPPLFRSVDGGGSWDAVAGVTGVRPVAIWPARGLSLATTCASLVVSLDAGATWTTHPLGTDRDITAFAVVAEPWVDDGVVAEAFAVVTSEGGSSFLHPIDLANPTTPQAAPSVRAFWGLAAVAFDGERLVLGTAQGVWVSDDAGTTWMGGRVGLEEVTISVDPSLERIPDAETGRGRVVAVAIDPTDPDRLFAGAIGGLFVSDDGGASWEAVPGVEGEVVALTLSSPTGRLFAETETGVVVVDIDPAA